MFLFKKIVASALSLVFAASCCVAACADVNAGYEGTYSKLPVVAEDGGYAMPVTISEDKVVSISDSGYSIGGEKTEGVASYYILKGDFTSNHKLIIESGTKNPVDIILDGYNFVSDSTEPMWEFSSNCLVNVYIINGTSNSLTSNAAQAASMIKTAEGCTVEFATHYLDLSQHYDDTDEGIPLIEDFDKDKRGDLSITSNSSDSGEDDASLISGSKINFKGDFDVTLKSECQPVMNVTEFNMLIGSKLTVDAKCDRKMIVHNYRQTDGTVDFGDDNTGTLIYLKDEWSNFIITDGKFNGKTDGYVFEGDVVNQYSITGGSLRAESTGKAIVYARRKLQDVFFSNGNVSMITSAPAAVQCQKPYFIPFSNGKAVIVDGGNVHIVAEKYAFASTVKEDGNITYEKMDAYNLFGELVYQHRINFENDQNLNSLLSDTKTDTVDLGHILYNDRLMSSGSELKLDKDFADDGMYMWLNEPKEGENDCLVFTAIPSTYKHEGALSDYMENIDTVPAVMKYDNSYLYILFERNDGEGAVDSITQISDNKLPKTVPVMTKPGDPFMGYFRGDEKVYDENGALLIDDTMTESVVLRARWKSEFEEEAVVVFMTFMLNGGESAFHNQYFTKDFFGNVSLTKTFVLPAPTKGEKKFLGWSLHEDGSGTLFSGEAETLLNDSEFIALNEATGKITLYAVWEGETYTSVMYGDANCDGDINMLDVTNIQKVIAKLITSESLGEHSAENSDVTHDNTITMEDVVLLQKYIAKLITSFE